MSNNLLKSSLVCTFVDKKSLEKIYLNLKKGFGVDIEKIFIFNIEDNYDGYISFFVHDINITDDVSMNNHLTGFQIFNASQEYSVVGTTPELVFRGNNISELRFPISAVSEDNLGTDSEIRDVTVITEGDLSGITGVTSYSFLGPQFTVTVVEGNVIVAEPFVKVPSAFILIVSALEFTAENPLVAWAYPKNCIGLFVKLAFELAAYLTIAIGISPAVNAATVAFEVSNLPVEVGDDVPCLHAKAFEELTTIKPYQSTLFEVPVEESVVNVAALTSTLSPFLRTSPAVTA